MALIPSPLFLNSFNYSNAAFIAISLGELPPLLAPPPSFGIAYLRKKNDVVNCRLNKLIVDYICIYTIIKYCTFINWTCGFGLL
jgi:hypothetical protein